MPGLAPGIHVFLARGIEIMDRRVKPGDDGSWSKVGKGKRTPNLFYACDAVGNDVGTARSAFALLPSPKRSRFGFAQAGRAPADKSAPLPTRLLRS